MKRKASSVLIIGMCLVLLLAALPFIGACAEKAAPAPAAPAPAAPAPAAPKPAPAATAPTAPTPTPTTPAKPAKTYELNFSSHFPSTGAQGAWVQQWVDKIQADSNGRIKIRVFPQASLIASTEMWDGVASGVADLGLCFRFEERNTEFLRYIGSFTIGAPNATTGQQVDYAVYDQFPEYRQEWSANKVLSLASSAPADLHFISKKVMSLDDFKGLQMRGSNKMDAGILSALGSSPVIMPMDEVYEALQKHIVDGYIAATETLQNWRLADVTKYTPLVGLRQACDLGFYMNWDTYNGLPADLQKVIDDDIPWTKQTIEDMLNSIEAPAIEYARTQKGHEFYMPPPETVDAWANALESVNKAYVDELNSKGYPGTELYQFVRAKTKEFAAAYAK